MTQLCQNLSDENDSLIAIAKQTIQTLKSLQGLPDSLDSGADGLDQPLISNPSDADPHSQAESPPQYGVIAREMDFVLDKLRSLLTNPSFVPLEEVEIQDEEISRLRQGWEEMEVRWSEAVSMMGNWHSRISNGAASIDADDLKQGIDIGLGRAKGKLLTLNRDEKTPMTIGKTDTGPLQPKDGSSMDRSDPYPTETSGDVDTHASSLSGSLRRSQRIRNSLGGAQVNTEEPDEEHDEMVLVDNPGLVNVQRRRPKARPHSKIPKQVRLEPLVISCLSMSRLLTVNEALNKRCPNSREHSTEQKAAAAH